MNKEGSKRFQEESKKYLESLSLNELRVYGRYLGLPTPTRFKKANLIDEITLVLLGEKDFKRTKRGAPIKNSYFSEQIPLTIEEIRKRCLGGEDVREVEEENSVELRFSVFPQKLNKNQKKKLNEFLNSL